jgi:hypothetical protein
MPVRRHHLLLAAALPGVLLLTGPAAHATCPGYAPCALDTPGSVEPVHDGGSGVLCEYVKLYAPPPSDWTGTADSPPPYVFTRTQEWGDQYAHRRWFDWDDRGCLPLCPPLPDPAACAPPVHREAAGYQPRPA